MDWSLFPLRLALLCYSLGFISTFVPLVSGGRKAIRLIPWLAGAGAFAHTIGLFSLGVSLGRCPLGTLPEVLSALAWAAILVYLFAWWRFRLDVLHLVVLPLVIVVMVASKILPHEVIPVAAGIRPAVLHFHLTAIVFGVAALFITFTASLVFVAVDRALKRKRPSRFFLTLPSLDQCDRIARISLMWAFPILTIGLITGAVLNAGGDRSFWVWNSRENLAMLAWAILAIVVTARVGWGWRGRKAAILTILGITAVFLRMLGV